VCIPKYWKSAIHVAREYAGRPRNFVGQHFWARGYFVSTVGRDERAIRAYIPEQERDDRRQDQRRFDEQSPPVGWLKWPQSGHVSGRLERLTTQAHGSAGGCLLSCHSDSQHSDRIVASRLAALSSVTYGRYARSSRRAIRAPRSGTYAANHCDGTLVFCTANSYTIRPQRTMLVRMWKPAAALTLRSSQRTDLETLVRSGKTPQRVVTRAKIILAAAEGTPNNAIARELAVSRPTVYLWRDRFQRAGIVGLLKDAPRPGRRRAVSSDQVQAVVNATLQTTPPDATHWSVRTMAKAQGLSHGIVHRIWRAHGLQPHRVESFKLSRDPDFVKKVRDVVGVYLHPPTKALVLCVDEKPKVQALDRTEPVLPLRAWIPARQTPDYIRHGTTNLFAALNVLDETVLARCAPQKRHTEFLTFLNHLDASVPSRRAIHLILDNYGTHTHPKVNDWFAARPRHHRHFVPTSSSWLNLIERWFAEITRKRIRRGTFHSVPDLIRAIEDYVTHHNRHAQPFLWTASAATILRKVRLSKEALKTGH